MKYLSLKDPVGPVQLTITKSKFIGYAYPIANADQAEEILKNLKKQYSKANHVCHAYTCMAKQQVRSYSDDGEPSNSAGPPIMGQIRAAGLEHILVAVIRFFGGTKLGVGGLIQAYSQTAKLTLKTAEIITWVPHTLISLKFDYPQLNWVMRTLETHRIPLHKQNMGLNAEVQVLVKSDEFSKIQEIFASRENIELHYKEAGNFSSK